MTLPHIGSSLSEGVMEKGRQTWKASPICKRCHLPAFPRGFEPTLQLCWTCCFPRRNAVNDRDAATVPLTEGEARLLLGLLVNPQLRFSDPEYVANLRAKLEALLPEVTE